MPLLRTSLPGGGPANPNMNFHARWAKRPRLDEPAAPHAKRPRWALGTLRPRWATLLAALIDDEEVMECSEGWRRDVKTVMKCSAGRPLRLRRALHYVASTLSSLGKTTSLLTQTRAGGSEREPLP